MNREKKKVPFPAPERIRRQSWTMVWNCLLTLPARERSLRERKERI